MNNFNKIVVAGAMTILTASAHAELIGHWSGDGNTNDLLGDNNGTLINEASYGEGYLNQAFKFDGSKDAVYLGTGLDVTTGLTISARFKTFSSSGEQQIFNNESAYEIALHNDTIAVAINTTDIAGWYWINTGWKVTTNEWEFVTMTYDSTAIRLYDELGTERFSVDYTGDVVNGNEARIGARSFNNSGFNGMIDEVSLYNTAIAPQNLGINLTASVPLPASFGLLAFAMIGMRLRSKSNR